LNATYSFSILSLIFDDVDGYDVYMRGIASQFLAGEDAKLGATRQNGTKKKS